MPQTTKQQQSPVEQDDKRRATIVNWARRLMYTKGYGWSKAMDTARNLYGEEQSR